MNRRVIVWLGFAVLSTVVAAQEPLRLPTGGPPKQTDLSSSLPATPALTDLEACHVDVSLQNETIVSLKVQMADLQKRYDVLQLQLDRANRTPPPKDGMTWSWERDPQTGHPKGYVKTETEAKP
jgi:hypothetical protein